MNDEKLIELVRVQPALYDLTNPKYMDADFKNTIWTRLGAEMKIDGSLCKTRWGNIRDNFRKSLNKQKTKSCLTGKNVKHYKYSQQLQFLIQFFEDRETFSNHQGEVTFQDLAGVQEQGNENVEISEDWTNDVTPPPIIEELQAQNASKSKSTGSSIIPSKKKKLSHDIAPKTAGATLMEYIVSRNESASFPPPPQDPIDGFLAGLAPALKKLPPRAQCYAKSEIFNIVQKYELEEIMNQEAINTARIEADPFITDD